MLNLFPNCLPQLASHLYAECIITKEVFKNARHVNRTDSEKSEALLDCMESKIEDDPSYFKKIVDILKSKDLDLESVAEALMERYCEYIECNSAITLPLL